MAAAAKRVQGGERGRSGVDRGTERGCGGDGDVERSARRDSRYD